MATTIIKQVMTPQPATVGESTSCAEAARMMRDENVGALLVNKDNGKLCGIVTDRDIAVRCVAEGLDPRSESVGDICSRELSELSPDDDVHTAVELMKQKAVRRLPVMKDGHAIGILSMGDLAGVLDPDSALGKVSTAPPNK